MSVVYSHEGELGRRNPEIMDSNNFGDPQQHCHQQHNNSGGGLLRYRSAPSSMLTSLVVGVDNNEEPFRSGSGYNNFPSTSSEMETMFAKLISSNNNSVLSNSVPNLNEFGGGRSVKREEGDNNVSQHNDNNGYSFGSHSFYQPQQIDQGLPNSAVNDFDGSFSAVNSMPSENNNTQTNKMGSTNCSNLIRQKSSPAGFFSNYSVDNGGLAAMKEVGSFRASDVVSNGSQATTTNSGLNLNGTLNFSTRPSSTCSNHMPQIAESGNEDGIENSGIITKCYMPSYTTNEFWDGSAFNASKTARNNGEIMFSTSNALELQDTDFGYQKHGLTHHLSLPSSSTKMTGMEKLFQIQGSVPCKIRAKRGFATHPRSIAERERRTRISTRIKKLQDLFPKSDKQTSTADMLDVAVEYIKDLQKQVKILTKARAKCTCSSK